MTVRGATAVKARLPENEGGAPAAAAGAHPVGGSAAASSTGVGTPVGSEPAADPAGEPVIDVGPIGKRLHPNHWDVAMRQLISGDEGRVLRAGFVSPPVGNFSEHPGSFDAAYEATGRPPCWQQPWCAAGTRPEEDRYGRARWVLGLPDKGDPEEVREIQAVDGERQWWRSYWNGPAGTQPMSPEEARNLRRSGGPATRTRPPAPRPPGASSWWPPPPPPPVGRSELSVAPGATSKAAAKMRPPRPPAPPSAEQAAVDHGIGDHPPGPIFRRERLLRELWLQRGRRNWVPTRDEARNSSGLAFAVLALNLSPCQCVNRAWWSTVGQRVLCLFQTAVVAYPCSCAGGLRARRAHATCCRGLGVDSLAFCSRSRAAPCAFGRTEMKSRDLRATGKDGMHLSLPPVHDVTIAH